MRTLPPGYDADFLSVPVDLPKLSTLDDAVVLNGTERIDYTHFSLAMSRSRKFAFWVAWNVDGSSLKKLDRAGIPFIKDPRVPAEFQVGDELYKNNRLDRGHLARRSDLLWGSAAAADKANTDSFHFTNITPQMDDFNQSTKAGLWGRLEDALYEDVEVDGLRVSVNGGPVFHDDDHVFRGVALPREFWKLITFEEAGALKSKAFLLTQNLDQLEALDLDEFRVFQVTLSDLEDRTNLTFPKVLHDAEAAAPEALEAIREPLSSQSDIRWS